MTGRDDNPYSGPSTGFAIVGTNQLFENNHVTNGDDCVIVNGPADNIVVRSTDCNGGASFSVGPGGLDADIKNILCVLYESAGLYH